MLEIKYFNTEFCDVELTYLNYLRAFMPKINKVFPN